MLIVDSPPRYVWFECPAPPNGGEPATLSLHGVEDGTDAPLKPCEMLEEKVIAFVWVLNPFIR